jgi:hypothetical protein
MEEVKRPSLNPVGRPKGSVRKPRITDYMTPEQIRDLVLITIAESSEDTPLAWDKRKWTLEQAMGKAAQSMYTEDENGNIVSLVGFNFITNANNTNNNTDYKAGDGLVAPLTNEHNG